MVPKEGVDLREPELAHIIFRDGLGAKHVQPRKQPAAARRFLVGDALAVHLVREIGVEVVLAVDVHRQSVDIVARDGVVESFVRWRCLIRLLDLLQHFLGDASASVLPVG